MGGIAKQRCVTPMRMHVIETARLAKIPKRFLNIVSGIYAHHLGNYYSANKKNLPFRGGRCRAKLKVIRSHILWQLKWSEQATYNRKIGGSNPPRRTTGEHICSIFLNCFIGANSKFFKSMIF